MRGMTFRYSLVVDVSLSSAPKDEPPPPVDAILKINLRGVLLAFGWVAIWGAGWGWSEWLLRRDGSAASVVIGQLAFCLLLLVPPPAAMGALVRRQLFGVACGLASALSLGLWFLIQE
jgi:hypothetical protein